MMPVRINRCIDKELRYYGLKFIGLIVGGITFILAWVKSSMIFGIILGVFGYMLGDNISKYWHIGSIQRRSYWYLPHLSIIQDKYFPKSCEREFL